MKIQYSLLLLLLLSGFTPVSYTHLNGSFGFKSVPNQIEMVDAAGFKELYNEQLRNEGNPEFDYATTPAM